MPGTGNIAGHLKIIGRDKRKKQQFFCPGFGHKTSSYEGFGCKCFIPFPPQHIPPSLCMYAETNCSIAHNLGILLMNSFAIFSATF